ncbi:MAG: hypothetical protein APR63_07320 [Desulfuromonas sp. SDB]|nr:MAG: hypothetical protein APR63_07320 [Desulfuromonas sp. SDB]
MKNQSTQINLELPDEVFEGTYANIVIIMSSPAEFVLDFARIVPGKPKAKIKSRVIIPPQTAKKMVKILEDRIKDYENRFGDIKIEAEDKNIIGFQN